MGTLGTSYRIDKMLHSARWSRQGPARRLAAHRDLGGVRLRMTSKDSISAPAEADGVAETALESANASANFAAVAKRSAGLHGGAGKRRLTRQHFVQHTADGINVGSGVDLAFTHRLLGPHVMRRAE